jgi:hypothetical protein
MPFFRLQAIMLMLVGQVGTSRGCVAEPAIELFFLALNHQHG